ncbi:LysR family transcriptional regulator [Tropicimonas isoalkanivorans]|uniref:DNA-binding transcriptional regulator, LysR family n=1 Tax=Tropicimonas isoalkanivorans TaxID=441112 RepID=A0A1I1HE67_9RHOB|nr:LysR substrate-binding domain-containing protein [Tropicimonas isoalkanivorans]SFC21902.1 DNA-binding transcriptional regulator, LysR family [Tropicimonas isoalkanivorans]
MAYEAMAKNIPTDLLRSFVTVVDLGNFTRAAEALGRTQPAISLQIRRLEELLQTKLILTAGRQFALTDAGVALGPYARQLLRLNDDIVAHFADASLSGWIRVGVPTDFSHSFLLEAIAGFAAQHPDVKIEIESLLSRDLRGALANDLLDMAVAIVPEGDVPYLVETTLVEPFWAIKETFHLPPKKPLPILRHPDPCEYATRMRAALRLAGRSWRTVLVSRDIAGLQTAVRAGLGATALTPATLLPGMRIGRADEGFPPLAPLRIGLFYKHAVLSDAGHGLAQHVLEHIQQGERKM